MLAKTLDQQLRTTKTKVLEQVARVQQQVDHFADKATVAKLARAAGKAEKVAQSFKAKYEEQKQVNEALSANVSKILDLL